MECCTRLRHNIVASAGAMADTVVVFVLRVGCRFLNLFLRLSRESNELFLGAASVISRPEIIEVSIAGKLIFVSKIMFMLKMFVEHTGV